MRIAKEVEVLYRTFLGCIRPFFFLKHIKADARFGQESLLTDPRGLNPLRWLLFFSSGSFFPPGYRLAR